MGSKNYSNATDIITFSRASNGTALRRVGFGAELVLNGNFDNELYWNSTGFNILDGVATSDSIANVPTLQQTPFSATHGKIYQVSMDITTSSVQTVYLRLNSLGNLHSELINNKSKTLTAYLVSGNNFFSGLQVLFTGGSGGPIVVDNVSVKEVLLDKHDEPAILFKHPPNIPRIEYDNNGVVKGLLIEETRTNFTPNSNFDAGWSTTRSALTPNQGTSPDGSNNAVVFSSDTTPSNSHIVSDIATVTTASDVVTASVYLKAGTLRYAQIRILDDPANVGGGTNDYVAHVDLQTGTITNAVGFVGTALLPRSGIENIGNGWYRVYIGLTKYGGATRTDMQVYLATNPVIINNTAFTGTGTENILIYGAQIEVGAFQTSYIPTEGYIATRASDFANISTSLFGYNKYKGSVVVVADSLSISQNATVLAFSDGTSNNQIRIQAGAGNQFVINDNGVAQTAISGGSWSLYQQEKVAVSYKENDFATCLNGGVVGTDNSGTIPNTLTTVKIGASAIGGSPFINGHIKSIKYYPRRLTNTQIQELTV